MCLLCFSSLLTGVFWNVCPCLWIQKNNTFLAILLGSFPTSKNHMRISFWFLWIVFPLVSLLKRPLCKPDATKVMHLKRPHPELSDGFWCQPHIWICNSTTVKDISKLNDQPWFCLEKTYYVIVYNMCSLCSKYNWYSIIVSFCVCAV